MRTIKHAAQRGDTLIEVLVALSVLGIVVVGTLSLMNKGVTQMYDSMEKSEVRLLLNQQIEMLTYARDQYLRTQAGEVLTSEYDQSAEQIWQNIRSTAGLALTDIPALTSECTNPKNTFFIGPNLTFSQEVTNGIANDFPSPGDGLWVQMREGNNGVPYKDFYVRACWTQNSSLATQVLSTVVRLYDK